MPKCNKCGSDAEREKYKSIYVCLNEYCANRFYIEKEFI